MNTHEPDFAAAQKGLWNASYRPSQAASLWGEPPVPFVDTAISLFRGDGARRVLDVPCGDGRNTPPLAAAFPVVLGLDSSWNALEIAASRLARLGIDNSVLLWGDLASTPFEDGQLDAIFCCDVLGHLKDPSAALTELLRICRPGGTIVGNVFAMEDSTRGDNMIAVGPEEYIFDNRFFFRFYDKQRASDLLSDVAAVPLLLEPVHWMEPPHEGYRAYEHDHRSWLFALRKEA